MQALVGILRTHLVCICPPARAPTHPTAHVLAKAEAYIRLDARHCSMESACGSTHYAPLTCASALVPTVFISSRSASLSTMAEAVPQSAASRHQPRCKESTLEYPVVTRQVLPIAVG